MEERPSQGKEEIPKVWDHSVEYVSAPPKPGEDPWKVILDPLMERDRIQCNAWKEEVQNLLIFAGLFSAVVTGFAIESYKNLQPDEDSDLLRALSHIAARLDNPENPSLVPFSSESPPSFSPTSSAIRVNIFWFLSLVLSLTTVLVGIISLQWLREYQSYPNFSPRETLALFHMRSDSFKQWHVGKIFASLPLLLQAALVLFFGGTIDFLLALDTEVAIPVTVVIGIALLFLIATTMLPTVQSFILYVSLVFFRRPAVPPSQCPYKSPQSWAFHRIYYVFSAISHHLRLKKGGFPVSPTLTPSSPRFFLLTPRLYIRNLKKRIVRFIRLNSLRWQGSVAGDILSEIAAVSDTSGGNGTENIRRIPHGGISQYHAFPVASFWDRFFASIWESFDRWTDSNNKHVLPHISTTWGSKSWIEYDLTWLLIRDSCQLGVYDKRKQLEQRYLFLNDNLPLFDVTKILREFIAGKTKRKVHPDSSFPVVYHCFRDLAASFLSVEANSLWMNAYYITPYHLEDIQDSWKYLDSLLFETDKPIPYITFVNVVAEKDDDSYRTFNHTLHNLHLLSFLGTIENNFTGRSVGIIKDHVREAHIRLMRTFYGAHGAYHTVSVEKPLPRYCRNLNLEIVLNNEVLFWQCLNVFVDYFKFISRITSVETEQYPDGILHDHPRVKYFLWDAAAYVNFMMRSGTFQKFQHAPAMERAIGDMLQLITDHLQEDLEDLNPTPYFQFLRGNVSGQSVEPEHLDLFYTSAVFSEQVVKLLQKPRRDEPQGGPRPRPQLYAMFAKLFHVMRGYKRQVIDVQGVNQRLQEQFEAHGAWERLCDFSSMSWWSFLDYFPSPSQNFAKLEPLLGYNNEDEEYQWHAETNSKRPHLSASPSQTQSSLRGAFDLSPNDDSSNNNNARHIRIDPRPNVLGGGGIESSPPSGGDLLPGRRSRRSSTLANTSSAGASSPSTAISHVTTATGTTATTATSGAPTDLTAIPNTATDSTPTDPDGHYPNDPKYYTVTIYEPAMPPPAALATGGGVSPLARSALRNMPHRQNSKDTDKSISSSLPLTDSPIPRRLARKAVPTFVPADILEENLDAGRTIRVYLPEELEKISNHAQSQTQGEKNIQEIVDSGIEKEPSGSKDISCLSVK